MILPTSVLRSAFPIALAVASLTLGGCGSKWKTYCEDKAQCIGGNDMDIDACIAEHDAERDVAAAYDCAEMYDKYQECKEKTSSCKSQSFSTDCKAEEGSVESCINAASARKK